MELIALEHVLEELQVFLPSLQTWGELLKGQEELLDACVCVCVCVCVVYVCGVGEVCVCMVYVWGGVHCDRSQKLGRNCTRQFLYHELVTCSFNSFQYLHVLSVVARLVDIHFLVRENDQCPFTHHFNSVLLLSSSGMAP